ncbi:MAG TPA: phytanoyl-CoA dioxygenase family protein [Pyrinomonadaceae bacterium]|nr:phytanoyl-CoA dioxygenase family protein [Pyrinomonadaceae bacterium]
MQQGFDEQIIGPKQIAQYDEQGYLVLERFVDTGDCDRLRARAEELVQEFDPAEVVSIFSTHEQNRTTDEYFLTSGDKIRFFFEENAFNPDGTLKYEKEKSINKIGHALHDLDPVFNRFSRSQKIKELAKAIGLENCYLLQSMYIFKQPNIGGEVTCHQDSTFLYTEPIDIAGLWFALEDATVDNGCLWALPGGHRHGLKSRWRRSQTDRMEFEIYDHEPWPTKNLVPLEVPKGTLIVLNGLLPHLSYENRSTRSRHAYTLHLISANAKYPADNWLQRSETMPLSGF